MNFKEFKNNVQQWATERGIYEHSTAESQLMKALSELGELADAIIKGDRDGIKDGVGDVAVCLVNYAAMEKVDDLICNYEDLDCSSDQKDIAFLAEAIGQLVYDGYYRLNVYLAFDCLKSIAKRNNFSFLECCSQAWNEIKDRKGRMVPGGAFVKESA